MIVRIVLETFASVHLSKMPLLGIVTCRGSRATGLTLTDDGGSLVKEAGKINVYLVAAPNVVINKASKPLNGTAETSFGNKPVDGGHLLLSADERHALRLNPACCPDSGGDRHPSGSRGTFPNRFRSDTERLEKMFEMSTKMTIKVSA